jgi:hypothetical protein
MATKNHIHPLTHKGTVQAGRMPAALPPAKTLLDDRGAPRLMQYLRDIAKEANYFNHAPATKTADGQFVPEGNWQKLLEHFSVAQVEALAEKAKVPPHLALLQLLLHLYEHPKRLLNANVRHHLNFYYRDVLQLVPAAPAPDQLHAVFELKKNQPTVVLPEGTLLTGGKDVLGSPLNYALTHPVTVSAAQVAAVKGLFVHPRQTNDLHFAPVANSADGLGADLPTDDPTWDAFGTDNWPRAQVGFALAAPVLRLAEGIRTIEVVLQLTGLPGGVAEKDLDGCFALSLTGNKGWIDKGVVGVNLKNGTTQATGTTVDFSVTLTEKDPPVVDYAQALHGSSYLHTTPVLQVAINTNRANNGYQFWKTARLETAQIDVTVREVSSLLISTDLGPIDAEKPFFAFGPQAPKNASCNINYPEAFQKILKSATLTLAWKNIPTANVGSYFSAYGLTNNSQFTAFASFEDAGRWKYARGCRLFEDDARQDRVLRFENPDYTPPTLTAVPWVMPVQAHFNLSAGEPVLQKMFAVQQYQVAPYRFQAKTVQMSIRAITAVLQQFLPEPSRKPGINLQLTRGFYFKEYRAKLAETVANFSKSRADTIALPAEPFAPEVKTVKLAYEATSGKIDLSNTRMALAGTRDAVHFYHLGPFGVRHEHQSERMHLQFVESNSAYLVPQYNFSGACYIGISQLAALDEVTLLLQVSPGSANPNKARTTVNWHVLANNYWLKLGERDLIFDTSNGLLTSGVVRIIVPKNATTVHTWMPEGLVWLRASVAHDTDAVCKMVAAKTQAAIARLLGNGYDMSHFGVPLPAGTTTKMLTPHPAIKSVTQPYAGFGGRSLESENAFYTRVSERLRHKNRAITGCDIERLALQAFPELYIVKAVQHSTEQSTAAAGHTLVVVVPQTVNPNLLHQLQPKVDLFTQERLQVFLEERASSWATFGVVNPQYRPVKVSCKVRLKPGFAFGYYRAELERVLQQFLAPWTGGNLGRFRFGGRVTAAQVINVLDQLPYVDFVAQLELLHAADGVNFSSAINEVAVTHPAAVLTSAVKHSISPY